MTPTRLRMRNDVIERDHATGRGPLDPRVHVAEARRLQAEAVARHMHRIWTSVWRIVQRLMNGKAREDTPAPNRRELPATLAAPRYSLNFAIADALSRGVLRLLELFGRFVVEPHARARRRRSAIAQLKALDDRLLADLGLSRGEIEVAVDGMLARRGDTLARPVERYRAAEQHPEELPLAA